MSRLEITLQILLLILAIFVQCENARADVAVIDSEQWTASARVWTGRAAVAEVGWHDGRGWTDEKRKAKRDEQIAVWYVLRNRWLQLQKRWPHMRFLDVLRAYCAGLGNTEPSKRQRWIRALSVELIEPAGWPQYASWDQHAPLWASTLRRADRWAHNRAGPNPCPGATHFGGLRAGDLPRGRMVRHECSERFERFRGTTFFRVADK